MLVRNFSRFDLSSTDRSFVSIETISLCVQLVYCMHMKYFTALYQMPVEGLAEWLKKPEAERKAAEMEMKAEWDTWLEAHKSSVLKTIALGKTKRVSSAGVEDVKNGTCSLRTSGQSRLRRRQRFLKTTHT